MSLQEKFRDGRGAPVEVNGASVVQMDRIAICEGTIRVKFVSGSSPRICGVALKSPKGGVELSNGRRVSLIHIWDQDDFPKEVSHRVECAEGGLRVWNIYRIEHSSGLVTEDAWTNNAGMIVENLSSCSRRYFCSDGIGEFDPHDFVFEIEWDTE